MAAARGNVRKSVKGFKSRALGLTHVPYDVEFYVAATSNASNMPIKITFKDANGNPINTKAVVRMGFSSSNGGAGTAVTSYALTGGGSGTLVETSTGIGTMQMGVDGVIDVTVTAGAASYYFFIIDNEGYRYDWNQALTIS